MAIDLGVPVRVVPRCGSAAEMLEGVCPALVSEGEVRVGVTGGQWSVIDVVRGLLACDLGHVECITVFSWRASRVDVGELFREVREGRLGSARLVISHEMKGIERLEFQALSEVCGDALRVCRSHLKGFVVARSGGCLLYLTSANFNRNGRNESYELHVGGSVAEAYAGLSDLVFAFQKPRAWEDDKAAGTKLFRKLLTELRLATPITVGESRADKARRRAGVSDAGSSADGLEGLDDLEDVVTLPVLLGAMRRQLESNFLGEVRRSVVPSSFGSMLKSENVKVKKEN